MSERTDRLLGGTFEPPQQESSGRVAALLGGDFQFEQSQPIQPTQAPRQEITGEGRVLTDRPPKISREPASFGALFKQGFVDDPKTKIEIFAKSRGIDPKRYGTNKNTGEVYFLDEDGYYHNETPDQFASKAKRVIAEMTADPSIPLSVALSTLGPGFAALGAAGGEGWRKTIGSLFFGDPQTTTENLSKMALSGVAGAVGEKIGAKAVSTFDRAAGKKGALLLKEAGRGRGRIDRIKIAEMERLGKKFGIDLLPPQTTRSPELIYEQTQKAVGNFLKNISKKELTREEAGDIAVAASKKLLSKGEKVRSESARPFYEKAFGVEGVDITPVVGFIDKQLKTAKGKVRANLLKAKKTLLAPDLPKVTEESVLVDAAGKPLRPKTEAFDTTLKGLHDAKTAIDDEIATAKRP